LEKIKTKMRDLAIERKKDLESKKMEERHWCKQRTKRKGYQVSIYESTNISFKIESLVARVYKWKKEEYMH